MAPDGVTGGGGRRMRFIVSSTGSHWKVEGNDPVRVFKDDLRHWETAVLIAPGQEMMAEGGKIVFSL